MKKYLLFATALVGITLAGCTSDDYLNESPPVTNPAEENVPIMFNSSKGNLTRANDITGAAAAELLGNKFVVSGYKGSSTSAVGSIVFDNYLVEYTDNTAYTTESNTRNWEYVGKGLIDHAANNGITRQTIKYWDYNQAQYDFIAWSTGLVDPIYSGTPTDGQVLVSAIDPANYASAAYTMEGKAADLTQCYVADLVTWKKANYGEEAVPITFRSLGTKVRIGIYETVPGYSVKNVKFYTKAGVLSNVSTEITETATIFTTVANNIFTEGKYTIFFPTVDDDSNADNNMAHIKFEPKDNTKQTTVVEWGKLNYTTAEDAEKTTGNVFLGRSSNTASYAGSADGNYFVTYLPNESGTNLNLRVDFTLESTDGSGEIIEVKSASAQVPLIYATWKPGYAYTYLFKISDKTNGHTGPYDPTLPEENPYNADPVGLYPITFDAVVVNSEDNSQETITTISTPSITTYQKGSDVANNNEYLAATGDIFVTVNENDAVVELSDDQDNDAYGALYKLPEGDYTEALVVDALSMQDDDFTAGTIKGRNGLELTPFANSFVTSIEYGADGNAINLTTGNALKFTPEAGTFAFVYQQKAPLAADNVDKYIAVSFDDASVTTKYRFGYKVAGTGDVKKGVLYFASETSGKKNVFLGQGVGNLFTRTGTGTDTDPYVYTQASGNAVTGTTYYYGTSKKEAHTVAYADFKTATLYVANATGDSYVAKTDEEPVDGKAYYYKEVDGTYTFCVIMPEQADGLKVLDTETYVQATETAAVDGQTYFDKFTVNKGVYYAKIIKIQ